MIFRLYWYVTIRSEQWRHVDTTQVSNCSVFGSWRIVKGRLFPGLGFGCAVTTLVSTHFSEVSSWYFYHLGTILKRSRTVLFRNGAG